MTFSIIFLLLVAVPAHSPDAPDVIVTSLADSGPGSLRQAIADAPPNGTIRFAVEGDIVLTSGELLIDKPLRVLGGHRHRVTVKLGPNIFDQRIFKITGSPVKISGLTIRDGNNFLACCDDLGGAIYNAGSLTLFRVTLRDNVASLGGGLYNAAGATATIINCTISGNIARDPGFGCDGGGWGGGVANEGGVINLISTTVTDNEGPCGGGLWQSSGNIQLINTIVANQVTSDPDCDQGFFNSLGGAASFISRGFNLDSDGSCGLNQPTDLAGVDPLLGPLQDNGGVTDTHEPLADSPAIDAGDVTTAPPRDQRGVNRPQGPAADIGSVEVDES